MRTSSLCFATRAAALLAACLVLVWTMAATPAYADEADSADAVVAQVTGEGATDAADDEAGAHDEGVAEADAGQQEGSAGDEVAQSASDEPALGPDEAMHDALAQEAGADEAQDVHACEADQALAEAAPEPGEEAADAREDSGEAASCADGPDALAQQQQPAQAASAIQASGEGKTSQQAASGSWDAMALSMDAGNGQLGATVVLKPVMTGATADLSFRYTIETNDGKDVTLLRRYKRGVPDFSFTLNRSGKVSIKLEVSDYKGKSKVLTRTLTVAVPSWNLGKLGADYQSGGATAFVPQLTGDTRYLRYRYTWTAADGSGKSGTIAAEGLQSAAFKPANGVYDIALQVVGTDGKAKNAAISYLAGPTRATFAFSLSNTVVYRGKSVTVKASGTDEDGKALSLAYSLASSSGAGPASTLATPAKGGFYPLKTKISSSGKQLATRTDTIAAWDLSGLSATSSGRTISAKALAAGIPSGFTYKFTYSGPAGSGTISSGKAASAKYWASMGGSYKLTVELYDASGKKVSSKSANVSIPLNKAEKMLAKAQGYSSATSKLILVNTAARNVGVYTGSKGKWTNVKFYDVSVGAPSTPTVKGTFTVGSKGYSFSGDVYTCYYWTQFYGNYLFHSVLYHRGTKSLLDPSLRMAISHGCVRMRIEDARWLQNNVPSGSKVVVY